MIDVSGLFVAYSADEQLIAVPLGIADISFATVSVLYIYRFITIKNGISEFSSPTPFPTFSQVIKTIN